MALLTHQYIAEAFSLRTVGQMQPPEPWNLGCGAPHRLGNLAVREQWQYYHPSLQPKSQALWIRLEPHHAPSHHMVGLGPGHTLSPCCLWLQIMSPSLCPPTLGPDHAFFPHRAGSRPGHSHCLPMGLGWS